MPSVGLHLLDVHLESSERFREKQLPIHKVSEPPPLEPLGSNFVRVDEMHSVPEDEWLPFFLEPDPVTNEISFVGH